MNWQYYECTECFVASRVTYISFDSLQCWKLSLGRVAKKILLLSKKNPKARHLSRVLIIFHTTDSETRSSKYGEKWSKCSVDSNPGRSICWLDRIPAFSLRNLSEILNQRIDTRDENSRTKVGFNIVYLMIRTSCFNVSWYFDFNVASFARF